MPYSFDDVLQQFSKDGTGSEVFGTELASMELASTAQINSLFPGVELVDSPSIAYFPFKLCNSLPVVNKRKRCFTPHVLQRSFSTITDQLVNFEHQISANYPGVKDDVIGYVKAARFTLPAEMASLPTGELAYKPASPYPVTGLGVLFRRLPKAESVLASHFAKTRTWAVSMECNHQWNEASFLYEDKFIPLKDAPTEMLQCLQADDCLTFKGKELAIALGGTTGKVDFWGVGITSTPADKQSSVLGFAAGRNRELASRKIFYMPFSVVELCGSEVASESVEKKINEIASVTVIGETDEDAGDKHRHLVLSDTTIMPTNGHAHSIGTMSIVRGTKPKLTAVTSQHYKRSEVAGRYEEQIHAHMINIPLAGKYNPSSSFSAGVGGTGATTPATPTYGTDLSSFPGDDNMSRTLQEVLASVNRLTNELVTAKTDEERARVGRELATINKEAAELSSEATINAAVDARIAAMVKENKLLTKEMADEAVTAAKTELEKKQAEANRIAAARAARLTKLTEAGIASDYEVDGIKDSAGKNMTIAGIVNDLPVDDNGDKMFSISFAGWKAMAESAKATKIADDAKIAAAAAAVVVAAAPAAASAPAAAAADTASKKSILLIAGAGPATGAETAAAAAKAAEAAAKPNTVIDGSRTAAISKGKGIFS